MSRDSLSTDEFLNRVVSTNHLDDVLECLPEHEQTLSEYLDELLIRYELTRPEVIKASGLNTIYGYQIFKGERMHPSRNKILAIILSMPVSLKEANRILNLSGVNELRASNRRDAILIYCIKARYSVVRTNSELYRHDEALVG